MTINYTHMYKLTRLRHSSAMSVLTSFVDLVISVISGDGKGDGVASLE